MTETEREAKGELSRVFDALRTRVIDLSAARILYQQLYTDEARVQQLRRAASVCFGVMQQALAQRIELYIARLMDRAKIGSQRNLTLAHLGELLAHSGYSDLAWQVAVRVVALKAKDKEHLRRRRDKSTVHFDLEVALGRGGVFPVVTWPIIDGIVRDIQDLMNLVQPVVFGDESITAYDLHVLNGNGDDLVRRLEMAAEHADCENARLGRPLRSQAAEN